MYADSLSFYMLHFSFDFIWIFSFYFSLPITDYLNGGNIKCNVYIKRERNRRCHQREC